MVRTAEVANPRLSQQIAERLKQFREKAGLEVGDIAVKTGISRSGILKMENPKMSNPTVESLTLYLKACDQTLFEFFDFAPWMPPRLRETSAVRTFKRMLNDPDKKIGLLSLLQMIEQSHT